VNRNYRPTSSGWALVLLSAAVLALGGCGRKAGLDLPPGAPPQANAAAAESAAPEQPTPFLATPGSGGSAPRAARGAKKSIILDPLLED
jgi:predicted small lipoprotein YifL